MSSTTVTINRIVARNRTCESFEGARHDAGASTSETGDIRSKSCVSRRLGIVHVDLTVYMHCNKEHHILCGNVGICHRHTELRWGDAAQRVLTTPNAGGNSLVSEVLSAEVLDRLLGIRAIKTEMELVYSQAGPITDFAIQIDTHIWWGVSVTRALAFKRRLTAYDCQRLLTKKLSGILISTENVVNCAFERQILHVWARSGKDAGLVRRVCSKLPAELVSNTLILITTANSDAVFFSNELNKL
ncbi:hypothetical protein BCR43DRAFT_565771 [Syncephalastrum racemosum]|uniref:Uncharacterized protein n=1 Tax=Syncephalastrum racemosum TaxID=13706 RepID=A0A1X2H587_SYNRA|nr:hypothetical protein BCR43DRAFT_565771 [Syncephalastrum racemosum]